MEVTQLLQTRAAEILAKAGEALSRARLKGYPGEESGTAMARLQGLYDRLSHCVETRKALPLIRYVEAIARDRFHQGVELFEVQTAFNTLEEAIWKEMRARMTPDEFIEAVGLLSTILGLGKDTLARSYVALAGTRHAPALDLDLLARGDATVLQLD